MQAASLEQITDYAQVRFDFLTDRKTTTLNQCLSLTAIKDDGTRPRTRLLEIKPTSVSKNTRKRALIASQSSFWEASNGNNFLFSVYFITSFYSTKKKASQFREYIQNLNRFASVFGSVLRSVLSPALSVSHLWFSCSTLHQASWELCTKIQNKQKTN